MELTALETDGCIYILSSNCRQHVDAVHLDLLISSCVFPHILAEVHIVLSVSCFILWRSSLK